jgi:pilus assembly protein Flp/PilA
MLARLFRQDEGQGMSEYAILVGLLAIGVVATFLAVRGKIGNVFNYVHGQVNTLP